ncbi:MAG: hypothetical protein EYC70_03165 [Planctomycetota bacterium]|nr:MAG: hypothetical protein EYC70_03165 [Planctomycetota bacterium]
MLAADLLLLAVCPCAQEAPAALERGQVARWDGGALTVEAFEAYLGQRLRGQSLGVEALRHLLQIHLVEQEAAARGLRVAPEALAERVRRAHEEITKTGVDVDEFLARRGLTAADFEKLLADSLLHEMLARQDLGRAPEEAVSNEELLAWTEQRLSALLAQAAEAPPGHVLNAPPFVVTEQQLGAVLRSALEHEQLLGYVHDVVLAQRADAWAQEHGVELDAAMIEEELEYQRRKAEESGVTLDALLQAMGTSVAQVTGNPSFRTTVLLRAWAQRRYDDAWFAALAAPQRQQLEERFGARREVSWILLRASAQKVDPLDLSFEEAAEELARVGASIQSAEDFGNAASKYSEDEVSRLRRGRLGWLHRRDARADPAVTAAAFAAEPGRVSAPVRTGEGVALLLVTASEPAPEEARFRDDVRRGLLAELRAEILAQARLGTLYD